MDFDKFGFWLKRSVKFGLIARRYRGGFWRLEGSKFDAKSQADFWF